MATRVAIIGAADGWHVGRLAAAVRHRGQEATVVGWGELSASLGPAGEQFGPEALAAADVIAVRGMPGSAGPEDRLEEVIFRMDVLGRVAAGGTPVVNSPPSLEATIDKYLSLARLAAAGIPVPRTTVAQDQASLTQAWTDLGEDCVAKPLFGSRGRGLARLTDPAAVAAWWSRTVADRRHAVSYLQEFVPHDGWDARLLLVGDRLFAMRRLAAPGDWRTNLACGGRPEPFTPPPAWADLARRTAAVLGTEIVGIDILPAADGRALVLEANGVPGWRGLEATIAGDVTGAVADFLLGKTAV
jgi:tetrahydromethanopterin:alpha-L-glutamate ligase